MSRPTRSTGPVQPFQSGIMACILDGLSDKETSRAMGCCHRTVRRHVEALMFRTGARNRTHLAALSLLKGL